MANFISSDASACPGDISLNSATKEAKYGSRFTAGDGREYRYAKAGGTALVVGNLLQSNAQVANHQNMTPSAAAIGATSVTMTLGATAATANLYAEGYMCICTTPGNGYVYKVASNPAADASASIVITLEDEIRTTAITASSRIDLISNPYSAVIQWPTTFTGTAVGVAQTAITASQYGFIQTKGIANVLNDGGTTVGTAVVGSNGTAGAVEAATGTQPVVGIALITGTTTENQAVYLNLV